MQSNNEMKMPGPELFAGNWNHLFGPGRAETQCRIVVDVANDALVAAQAFDGLKWFDLSSVERADLAESLFEVNEISNAPANWNLSPIDAFPQWASSAEVLGHIDAQPRETSADPVDLLTRLVKWAEQMGGWEAPVWAEASSFVATHQAKSLSEREPGSGASMPTNVRKSVVQFTVLHDDGKDLSSMPLGDIVRECDDGSYVGGDLAVLSNEVLTREQLDAEAGKLGSDATFFVDDADEMPRT